MDEKNSHNRKQLWEDGIKLEPWIFKRMDQDLREILLRSSNAENDDENHQNCWGTSEQRRIEMMNQRWKEFERSWRKTFDWWWLIVTSNLEMNLRIAPDNSKSQVRSWKKTYGLGPTKWKHRRTILKRDCTGWIKWLEWDTNLERAWTNAEWKHESSRYLEHSGITNSEK